MGKLDTTLSITMSTEMLARFREIARAQDRSVSYMIRKAVQKYMDEAKEPEKKEDS